MLKDPTTKGVFTLGDARSFFFLGSTSKISSLGSMLNFDADVKETTARHQCENPSTRRKFGLRRKIRWQKDGLFLASDRPHVPSHPLIHQRFDMRGAPCGSLCVQRLASHLMRQGAASLHTRPRCTASQALLDQVAVRFPQGKCHQTQT